MARGNSRAQSEVSSDGSPLGELGNLLARAAGGMAAHYEAGENARQKAYIDYRDSTDANRAFQGYSLRGWHVSRHNTVWGAFAELGDDKKMVEERMASYLAGKMDFMRGKPDYDADIAKLSPADARDAAKYVMEKTSKLYDDHLAWVKGNALGKEKMPTPAAVSTAIEKEKKGKKFDLLQPSPAEKAEGKTIKGMFAEYLKDNPNYKEGEAEVRRARGNFAFARAKETNYSQYHPELAAAQKKALGEWKASKGLPDKYSPVSEPRR
jgi:hypothetical protein